MGRYPISQERVKLQTSGEVAVGVLMDSRKLSGMGGPILLYRKFLGTHQRSYRTASSLCKVARLDRVVYVHVHPKIRGSENCPNVSDDVLKIGATKVQMQKRRSYDVIISGRNKTSRLLGWKKVM